MKKRLYILFVIGLLFASVVPVCAAPINETEEIIENTTEENTETEEFVPLSKEKAEEWLKILESAKDDDSVYVGVGIMLLNGEFENGCAELFLNKGFYIENIDLLKESGAIPEDYSLPESVSSNELYEPMEFGDYSESVARGHSFNDLDDYAFDAILDFTSDEEDDNCYIDSLASSEKKSIKGTILNNSSYNNENIYISFLNDDRNEILYSYKFSKWISDTEYELNLGINIENNEIKFDQNSIIPNDVEIAIKMDKADMNYNIYKDDTYIETCMSDENGFITMKTNDLTVYRYTTGADINQEKASTSVSENNVNSEFSVTPNISIRMMINVLLIVALIICLLIVKVSLGKKKK